jgi:hypothetical protein
MSYCLPRSLYAPPTVALYRLVYYVPYICVPLCMTLCTYYRLQSLYVPFMPPPVYGPRSVTPLVPRCRSGVYDLSDQVDTLFQFLYVSINAPLTVHVVLYDILCLFICL